MNKYLGHWITAVIDGFYLLRGDVFSLCQLENVLLSVNDLQSAVLPKHTQGKHGPQSLSPAASPIQSTGQHCPTHRKPFPNVSRVQPSVLVDGLRCFLRVSQVPLEYIWSFDANLEQMDEKESHRCPPLPAVVQIVNIPSTQLIIRAATRSLAGHQKQRLNQVLTPACIMWPDLIPEQVL